MAVAPMAPPAMVAVTCCYCPVGLARVVLRSLSPLMHMWVLVHLSLACHMLLLPVGLACHLSWLVSSQWLVWHLLLSPLLHLLAKGLSRLSRATVAVLY